jgi:hypothetical protein
MSMESFFNSFLHPSGRTIKFGRLEPKRPAALKAADFLTLSTLPTPPSAYSFLGAAPTMPSTYDWENSGDEAALENIEANDRYSCCTCAAVAHIRAVIESNSGNAWTPMTVQDVLWLYSQVSGPPQFDQATGSNDVGCDEVTVLDFWRDHGAMPDGSGKILAYMSMDATRPEEVAACLWLFENGYRGAGLPTAWLGWGCSSWDIAGPSVPKNGHAFCDVGYTATGTIVDSWGKRIEMTNRAGAEYCNGSSYVVLSQSALNKATGKAPNGFDLDKLQAYLNQV